MSHETSCFMLPERGNILEYYYLHNQNEIDQEFQPVTEEDHGRQGKINEDEGVEDTAWEIYGILFLESFREHLAYCQQQCFMCHQQTGFY